MNRDKLIEKTAEAIWLAQGYDLNADPESSTAREMRPQFIKDGTSVLDAVLPLIEADIREQVAQEIEALSDQFVRMSNEGTTLITITEANGLVCGLLSPEQWEEHHRIARGATQQEKS